MGGVGCVWVWGAQEVLWEEFAHLGAVHAASFSVTLEYLERCAEAFQAGLPPFTSDNSFLGVEKAQHDSLLRSGRRLRLFILALSLQFLLFAFVMRFLALALLVLFSILLPPARS